MQLLALTHQRAAATNISRHHVESHNPTQQRLPADTEAVQRGRKVDGNLAHDDQAGASLLDTPAPRRRPPVPTQYESSTASYQPNNSSHFTKTSATQSGM